MELYAALPTTFLLLLAELIVGTGVALLIVELQLEVGPGFLQFMGVSVLATLGLAVWAADGTTRGLMVAALVAALAYTAFSFRPRQAPRVASAAGFTALSAAGLATAVGPAGGMAAASLGAASLALGSSMTGMLLGHWYLVAPMLSSRPLLRLTSLFLVALVAQAIILGLLVPEVDRLGMIVWIRGAFGIVIPLVMGGFVWYSCRIRAMRTATGILYLAATCVLMGDVAAKVFYILTSVPV